MRPLLIIASMFLLQACSMTAVQLYKKGSEFVFGKDVNLLEKSYAAADYLIQQSGNRISVHDLIKVEPLVNQDAPQLSAPLATVLPEQIGQRFVQLGYAIDLSAVAQAHDASFERPLNGKVADILGGTYREVPDGYQINLRISDVKTGRVDGAFSFILPYNREIRDLAKPEPSIIAVQEK